MSLMRWRPTSALAVAALLGACSLQVDDVGDRRAAIVNGELTDGDPAVGLIWNGVGVCSATLVSPTVMVTAKHCILINDEDLVPPPEVEVYWGADPEPTHQPTVVVAHEYHSAADIAVLELATMRTTEPVPMNTALLEPLIGEPVRIVGYGVTREGLFDHGVKRMGDTTLDELSPTPLGEAMLTGQTGSGTCDGDSGGPAFMTIEGVEQLVGVTSFGTGPCGNSYDAAMRVDIYHEWISAFVDRAATDPTPPPKDSGCTAATSSGSGPLVLLILWWSVGRLRRKTSAVS